MNPVTATQNNEKRHLEWDEFLGHRGRRGYLAGAPETTLFIICNHDNAETFKLAGAFVPDEAEWFRQYTTPDEAVEAAEEYLTRWVEKNRLLFSETLKPLSVPGATANLNAFIADFVDEYSFYGGNDQQHAPSQFQKTLIEDAIHELLKSPDFQLLNTARQCANAVAKAEDVADKARAPVASEEDIFWDALVPVNPCRRRLDFLRRLVLAPEEIEGPCKGPIVFVIEGTVGAREALLAKLPGIVSIPELSSYPLAQVRKSLERGERLCMELKAFWRRETYHERMCELWERLCELESLVGYHDFAPTDVPFLIVSIESVEDCLEQGHAFQLIVLADEEEQAAAREAVQKTMETPKAEGSES